MTRTRFAPHLGFPAPDQPLFDALVVGADPGDHIAFAAEQGFGGVADPFTAMRSADAQGRIGEAAARCGLRMGSFLYLPFDRLARARWASRDAAVRSDTLDDVREAIAIATRLGSDRIVILSVAEQDGTVSEQHAAMAEMLRFAGDLVGRAGLKLCVEGVSPQRLPQMLLHGVAASAQVVRQAAHPAVALCFDSGHAASSGEDAAAMLCEHHDIIATIQIADYPGRVEMGGGTIDFVRLIEHAAGFGLDDRPFELEHRWSVPGAAIQRVCLDQLEWWP